MPAKPTPRKPPGKVAPPREALPLSEWDVEFRPYKPLGFRPACVVVGISSEGIVGPLVASQLIQQLRMDQVCAIESPLFPPISVIYFQKPKFPARIYASKKHRLVVVLAEFAPMDEVARPLAHAILSWSASHRAERIVGIDAFPAESATPAGVGVAAVGATHRDREAIAAAKLNEVQHGALTGVAAILLNETRWQDRDAIVLMASLSASTLDTEAAVRVLDALEKLLPKLPLRAKAFSEEPTRLERAIRAARLRTDTHEFI